MADTHRGTHLPVAGFFLLAGVTLFWGANWPGMKIALAEVPVWWFRSMCLTAGGGGLLIIAAMSGTSLKVPAHQIPLLLLCAVFNIMGWHLFSAYGVQIMPAGRASIIAFTMPVWAALLGSMLIGEPLTRAKLIGLTLGIASLAVLIGEDLLILNAAPLGAVFMLMAAISWAIGTVLFKKFDWQTPVSANIGWQLLAAAVPITIVAVLTEPVPDLTELSRPAIIALAYLFVFPMIFCQWAYFKTVRLFPASIAAIGTMAVPIVGVYSSALILGEPVGASEFISLLLICSALFCVLIWPALDKRKTA